MTERLSFAAVNLKTDPATRTISGLLLPFGVTSRPAMDGQRYQFSADSIAGLGPDDGPAVLNYGHDQWSLENQLGVASSMTTTEAGVEASFKIARTPEGDRVLALADPEVGVIRSFSAEVEGDFTEVDGVQHAKAGTVTVTGGAVVLKPAFTDAAITSVAASAAEEKEGVMPEQSTTEPATAVGFSVAEGTALSERVDNLAAQVSSLAEIQTPVDLARLQVREEPIYRFAGDIPAPSGFDFAGDLLAAGLHGDAAALARLRKFTATRMNPTRLNPSHRAHSPAMFADQPTTTADTDAINPDVYRPDMFLGQAPTPRSPLYDFFYKGAVSSVTPFFYAKLDRANTDVGVSDHVEDTAAEDRDIVTAAGATVTPAPVSGTCFITREVADQGGNPNVSGLVWSEFDRSFAIALETKTAALVTGSAATELGSAIAAGSTGTVAGAAVEAGLVGLQFLADGFRFERAFGHQELYTALAAATKGDDNADKLYPIVNPQSTSGDAQSRWAQLNIGGFGMLPAASLGAVAAGQKSYVADPQAVHVWNSGLQRLDKLEETVEGWKMAVWGYFAGVVYDVTGLRKITFDSTA